MAVPNIGDILMLSQVAWKTGRVFTAGRKDAPSDFHAVETDISGLAHALKLLAEALHAENRDGLIPKSRQTTQDGVAIILSSCKRTIHDLDSLVDRYQVIRRHRTPGGYAIERTWNDLVLAQYDTIIWTAEGGNLRDLGSLLQMHTKSIRLLTDAIQSRSLSQLETVVTPLAERFDSMYDLPGSLEDQLEQVSRFVQELALVNSPTQVPPIPQRNPARSPIAELPDPLSAAPLSLPPPALSPRRTSQTTLPSSKRPSAAAVTSPSIPAIMDTPPVLPLPSPPTPPRKRASEFSFGGSSVRDSTSSYASSVSSAPSRTSPNTRHTLISVGESVPLPRTPQLSETETVRPNTSSSTLLPSVAQPAPDLSRIRSPSTLSPFPARRDSISKLHRSSTTASQNAAFEKDAFRNSAVLCDVRGTLVEYSQPTQPDPDCPGNVMEIEMVEACDSCRIAVVRKRITDSETKRVRVVTSIWAFSSDNNVRVELAMSDDSAYIPYSSYFSLEKVSMTVPCELKFHDVRYGNRLLRTARTSWVNFVFADAEGATLFQNEIMGRTLLATFRTSKTMRIHDGPMAAFAYAEQMCALENLRIWEDADTGAVIGLVHFSASFRPGYLAFYLNSSNHSVSVTDCGAREVKIKGLRVPIAETSRAMRKDSVVDDAETITEPVGTKKRRDSATAAKKEKKADIDRKRVISGARIEFASEAGKKEFLALVKEYQSPERLCELPDLLGVN